VKPKKPEAKSKKPENTAKNPFVIIVAVMVIAGGIVGGVNHFLRDLGGDERLDQLTSQKTPSGLLTPMSPELATAFKLIDEGNDEAAETMFLKLIQKVKTSNDQMFISDVLCGYGDFLNRQTRHDEAAELYRQGAEKSGAAGKKVNQAIFLGKRALAQHLQYVECGTPKPDLALIKKVNDLLDPEVGEVAARERAIASVGLAMILVDNGQLKEADAAFEKAAKLIEKLRLPRQEETAHLAAIAEGKIFSLIQQGRYKEANSLFIKALADYPEVADETTGAFRRCLAKKQMANDGLYPTVRTLLLEKKFDELERIAQQVRADVSGTVVGKKPENLNVFYRELNSLRKPNSEANWKKRLALFQEWVKSKPDSTTAKIALADVIQSYAWKSRGGGYAESVSDDAWKGFEERLVQAQKVLDQVTEKPPEWYSIAQTNGLGQSWEKKRYDALVDECQKKYPIYDKVIFEKFHWLQPRWHGKPGDAEAYLEAEAAKRSKQDGDMLYARTAGEEDRQIGSILYETKLKWPRIKDGFIALRKAFPNDLVLRGQMTILALQANDKAAAATSFDDVK
jgi:hypothetical protein